MTQLARLTLETSHDVAIARVEGEIDLSNAEALRHRIADSVPNEALGLVVDFAGVTYLDSSGIRLLFDMARRLERRQQRFATVVEPATPVWEILEMVGAPGHLTIVGTFEEAVDAVREAAMPAPGAPHGARTGGSPRRSA